MRVRGSEFNNAYMHYLAHGRGVEVRIDGYHNDRLYTYTEIWDALALYAIRKLAETKEQAECFEFFDWQAENPDKPGEYVCVVRWSPELKPTRRVLYWNGYQWHLNRSAATTVADMVQILGWIRLPDEDPEEVAL